MDRTRNLSVATNGQSNRDLIVGLIGAIVSLSVAMYQNISSNSDETELLQSLVPIQQQLSRLILRLKKPAAFQLSAGPTPRRLAASIRSGLSTPRRHISSQPRQIARTKAINSTVIRTPPADIPPGWREISNLDDYLDESSEMELGMGSEGTLDETPMISGFEYSQDMDYYPSLNPNVSDPESSDQFMPIHQSTRRNFDDTYHRPSPLVGSRVPTKRTYRRADGTYAVKETINITNPDGSFQRISRTVSGPDISAVQNISGNTGEQAKLERTRTMQTPDDVGLKANVTFDMNKS